MSLKRAAKLFTVGASLDVPFCTVVLRKGYGLGAQSMAGGSFKAPSLVHQLLLGQECGKRRARFRRDDRDLGARRLQQSCFAQRNVAGTDEETCAAAQVEECWKIVHGRDTQGMGSHYIQR